MFLLKPTYKKETPGRSSNTVTFLPRKVYPGAGEQLLETNIDMWHAVFNGCVVVGRWRATQVWSWRRLTQLQAWTELRRVHQQWKPNFPSSHAKQRDFPSVKVYVWSQLLGNMSLSSQEIPRCPKSGLQCPRPNTVATNKAIWCPLQTTDPFLSPEKAGQKSGCGAYTDDRLLLQGKALFFPLPMKQGMLGKSHLPPSLPASLVLYWFLENSLKRKPGVLHCSLPSPKAKQIVSSGREGTQKRWSHQPPLYVSLCPGSLSRLTCLPAPEPCVSMCINLWHVSDSATLQSMYEWLRLPLLPPLNVNPGIVLGDPVLLWLWLPLLFAYFPNTFPKSFPLSFVRCPFVRREACPREWDFKFCSVRRHWLVFTLRAVFSG